MAESSPTEYFIQGITSNGRKFRPSDWSGRLCGMMSGFGPKAKGPNARLQYSIYVRPTMIGDINVVILDSRLRDIEPMAFDFVLNFAKNNDLTVTEACELPAASRHANQAESLSHAPAIKTTQKNPPSFTPGEFFFVTAQRKQEVAPARASRESARWTRAGITGQQRGLAGP